MQNVRVATTHGKRKRGRPRLPEHRTARDGWRELALLLGLRSPSESVAREVSAELESRGFGPHLARVHKALCDEARAERAARAAGKRYTSHLLAVRTELRALVELAAFAESQAVRFVALLLCLVESVSSDGARDALVDAPAFALPISERGPQRLSALRKRIENLIRPAPTLRK